MEAKEILAAVAKEASERRPELVQAYKKQGKGNVRLDLSHGFCYVYGSTVKIPQIVFPNGFEEDDLGFFKKAGIWD